MIRYRDLRYLPFHSLRRIAESLARDIDAGDNSKRHLLDLVFAVIQAF